MTLCPGSLRHCCSEHGKCTGVEFVVGIGFAGRGARRELASVQQGAGVGAIDGNEVGHGAYDMYFFGADREVMWDVIGPILDDAPAEWTKAELREGVDDDAPIVFET